MLVLTSVDSAPVLPGSGRKERKLISADLAYAKKKLAIYVKPIGDVWGDHYF